MRQVSTSIEALVHVYTSSESFDKQCEDLVETFDAKRIDDDMKEILRITKPSASMEETHGWHLERLAASEFGPREESLVSVVQSLKKDFKSARGTIRKGMKLAKQKEEERATLLQDTQRKVDVMFAEVSAAKKAVEHTRNSASVQSPLSGVMSSPVPVDQRLKQCIKEPEKAKDVDLSNSPSI